MPKDNLASVVKHENALTEKAHAAGVIRDAVLVRIGTDHHKDEIPQEWRWCIATAGRSSCFSIAQERAVFRWLKSIVGIRHLLSDHKNDLTLQFYAAWIASLLIVLWTGLKVSNRNVGDGVALPLGLGDRRRTESTPFEGKRASNSSGSPKAN